MYFFYTNLYVKEKLPMSIVIRKEKLLVLKNEIFANLVARNSF